MLRGGIALQQGRCRLAGLETVAEEKIVRLHNRMSVQGVIGEC